MDQNITLPRSESPPVSFGPYRLERLLGRGGMGDVIQAWDPRLERRVAIKYVRQSLAEDWECCTRLRREARLVASIHHPSIVQIFDVLQTEDGGEQIVMEFIDGPTLKDLLQTGPLEVETAVRLGLEIVRGLGAAHGRGVLHRDLKAENVMLTPAGEAKILDFGLSKSLHTDSDSSITLDGSVLGTARVMSPEQAEGDELDCRSDLFSFGVLLYEMLSGRSPFRASTTVGTILKIRLEPHPDLRSFIPHLPEALRLLIDRLLQKDREDRPRDTREVAAALETMALGMPGDSALLRSRIRAHRSTSTAADLPQTLRLRNSEVRMTSAAAAATSEPPLTQTIRPAARGRSVGSIAALATAACLSFAVAWWLRAQEPVSAAVPGVPVEASAKMPAGSRIVVLPLANHGPAQNDYFAAGLTSELVRELTFRQEVAVVSYRLSRNCGSDSWSISDLGSELQVTHVLEGDVAWEPHPVGETRLRVGLQLIRVDDGQVVMSRTFDRSASEVLRVQEEIADFVSRDLASQLVYGVDQAAAAPSLASNDKLQAADNKTTIPHHDQDPEMAESFAASLRSALSARTTSAD